MMRLVVTFSLFAVASAVDAFKVTSLSKENYDELTEGKTVFIKFIAPWCAHCKRMAPDWAKLAEEWDGDKIGLVAEVDCTEKVNSQTKFCEIHDVRSFPTIKYGNPNDLEEYNGGRKYEDLSAFAKENLVLLCSPGNLDLCDDENKKDIEKYLSMSNEELQALVAGEERKLKDANKEFDKKLEELQKKYGELEEERDEAIAAVANGGLGLMKSVTSAKENAAKEEDEGNDEL